MISPTFTSAGARFVFPQISNVAASIKIITVARTLKFHYVKRSNSCFSVDN